MAVRETLLDPRLAIPEADVRPVVALPRAGVPAWLLVVFALAAALILFAVLNARRQAALETGTHVKAAETGVYAPPPPLYMPAEPAPVVQLSPAPAARPYFAAPGSYAPRSQAVPSSEPRVPPPRQAPSYAFEPSSSQPVIYVPQPEMAGFQSPASQPRADGGNALVVDTTAPAAGPEAGGGASEGGTINALGGGGNSAPASSAGATLGSRARAGTLANRSVTVPQGTLISAVIETAFNSDRPGFARAVVSRDVRGFDGSRVLIPRGSRLIGEYRSDVAPGQRRALVNWVRLVRPDGVTMTIASPSTDTLGRAGMSARVNTHFFARFGSALLRSVIDLGRTYATSRLRGPLVLLPGSSQGAGGADDGQIRPTLSVPAGRSISVFVARDLDFSGAGGRE